MTHAFAHNQPIRCTRRQRVSPVAAAANLVAAAAPAAPGGGDQPSFWARITQLATTLTNFFPVFVLGAAVWALVQPAAFDWFERSAITPVLALTMVRRHSALAMPSPPRRLPSARVLQQFPGRARQRLRDPVATVG
jgi:hypothetical protein